ncbi:hypothetical protein SEPCBS57363_000672 [Sporothrix epigloea]|uniref:C2H2-type domain-containing protein n=1 Tax=Sporothrix epigloea TaxID=1892477 RepID=A0ABP0D947_9PEZI
MAMDAPGAASGLPSAKMTAARQHVQTLSIIDREALLCALLEQHDLSSTAATSSTAPATSKSASSRLSAPPSSTSISAWTTSLFDCPPLQEEAPEAEDSPSSSSPPQQPTRSSTSSSAAALSSEFSTISTPTTTSSHSTAPSPTPSSHLRSQSMLPSPQLLRSAFSSYQSEKTSSRSRSQSFQPTPSTASVPQSRRTSSDTRTLSKPTLAMDLAAAASLSTITAPLPQQQQHDTHGACEKVKQYTYWCTACGKKMHDRAAWARHDVACRGNEQCLTRDGYSSRSSCSRDNIRPQRAWGCGFCAAFLGSLERYQTHVAGHFERGFALTHWLFANVIYGLLHQRAVHEQWRQLWKARVAALPSHLRPKATWSPGCTLPIRVTVKLQVSLQEALEVFDECFDSASALARQADALAIFIAVPVEDDAQKLRQKAVTAEPAELPAEKTKHSTRPDNHPSPTASAANLLPNPPLIPLPPASPNTASTKSSPLPVLSKAKEKNDKPASKFTSRRPSFLFKSKASISSLDSAAEKRSTVDNEPATRQENSKPFFSGTKLTKSRSAAPASHTPVNSLSCSSSASPTTTATSAGLRASMRASSHHGNWADRPLPPPIKNGSGLATGPSSLTAHPVHMRAASAATHGQWQRQPPAPPAPPPKPGPWRKTTDDWESTATTSVKEIMVPANA